MTLTEIINQLRSCNYECEAGKLENNVAWLELEHMAKNLEEMARENPELWWWYVSNATRQYSYVRPTE